MDCKLNEKKRAFYLDLLNNTELTIIDEYGNTLCSFGNIEYEIEGNFILPKDDKLKNELVTKALLDGYPTKYSFVNVENEEYHINLHPHYLNRMKMFKDKDVVITKFRISLPA